MDNTHKTSCNPKSLEWQRKLVWLAAFEWIELKFHGEKIKITVISSKVRPYEVVDSSGRNKQQELTRTS